MHSTAGEVHFKNGCSAFLLSSAFDRFLGFICDSIKEAMERLTELLWLWKALGGRVAYCLGKKKPFNKDQTEIKTVILFLVRSPIS